MRRLKSILSVALSVVWMVAVAGIHPLRAASSAGESGGVTVKSQIAYRQEPELASASCQLDLYLPKPSDKAFPVMIWVHGGGLTGGDKAEPPSAALSRMLAQHGIAVASVNYRLSPKVSFPVYIEDVAAAVAWVEKNAKGFGGNPARIFLSGHSAGAYLVAMLTMNPKFLTQVGFDWSHLAGVIPISGQVTTHFTVRKERGIGPNTIISDEASPLYFARQEIPDMLLILGDHDWPARLEENQYFAACLKAAGAGNVIFQVVPNRDHGTIFGKIPEPGDPAGKSILQFIHERETGAKGGAGN